MGKGLGEKAGFWNVVYLNCVLMIYCSAVNSGMGIVSQVFDERGYLNLGNTSLFVIYLFSGINNILAPSYVKKFKFNHVFLLSSMGYIFFLCEGILVCSCSDKSSHFYCSTPIIFTIIVFGSAICGIFSSILYVAQNEYISENTNESNKSLLFGIAWALLQSSYIVGNVTSMFLIEPLGQFGYFCLLTAIAAATSILFFFVRKPQPYDHTSAHDDINEDRQLNQDSPQSSQRLLAGNEREIEANSAQRNEFEGKIVSNTSDVAVSSEEYMKLPVKEQVRVMFDMMKMQSIRPLLYYMFSSGIIMSFGFGVMYRIVKDSVSSELSDEEVDRKTFQVNIVLGCFEFIGGALITPLADKFNKKRIAIATNLIFEAAIIASVIAHYEVNYFLCFVVAGIWGMTDCSTQSMNCNLISSKYGDDIRVFGIWNLVQCVGAFIGMIFSIAFKQVDIVYYLLIVAVIQVITNIALQKFKLKDESQKQRDPSLRTQEWNKSL